jgi:glyoxylase-like metal-dependent hydrolase (beta-lactamase superfamily II)
VRDNPANSPTATIASPTIQIGDTRVTALSDGHFDLQGPVLVAPSGAPLSSVQDTLHIDVNAFLVQTPEHTILIDTGCGHELGPTVNRLLPNLRAEGVDPRDIDAVVCTHIHPDHTNGLAGDSGQANFPNAQVFAHQRELDFWLSEDEMSRAPDALKGQFAWAMKAFAPYTDRIQPFENGRILPDIDIVPLFGHTPGHCGFQIDGGDAQILIWGDLVHAIEEQSRNPDIAFIADVDRDSARSARKRMFDRIAQDNILVAGMHLPFPGFGRLERDGAQFAYAPI